MNEQTSAWGIETLLASLVFMIATVIMGNAHAQNTTTTQSAQFSQNSAIQLAHGPYRGHRWHHGPGWRHPHWHGGYRGRHVYWTGWNPVWRGGYRCHRSCLVDRWSGRIIRCRHRCW